MRIAESARKHSVTDENMLHAARHAIAQWHLDEGLTMRVGPATNGELLEVGLLGIDTDDPVIIHAMPSRARYLPRPTANGETRP